jgi:hypothetical protein
MSRIFDVIKSFFGGFFSFLGGLFGGSKQLQESTAGASANGAPKTRKTRNSGYFLELDEARSTPSAEPAKVVTVEAPAKAAEPKAEPVAAAPAKSVAEPAKAPEPVKAIEPAKPAANPLNLPQPTVTTFAPEYLAPSGDRNGRRRPGANMNYFLDLARQVKTSG